MKTYIVGNWKLNFSVGEASIYLHKLLKRVPNYRDVEVVVAPGALALQSLSLQIDRHKMKLASQNAYYRDYGAYTGEVSFNQLRGLADYCIVGHSERRYIFKELIKISRKKSKLPFVIKSPQFFALVKPNPNAPLAKPPMLSAIKLSVVSPKSPKKISTRLSLPTNQFGLFLAPNPPSSPLQTRLPKLLNSSARFSLIPTVLKLPKMCQSSSAVASIRPMPAPTSLSQVWTAFLSVALPWFSVSLLI